MPDSDVLSVAPQPVAQLAVVRSTKTILWRTLAVIFVGSAVGGLLVLALGVQNVFLALLLDSLLVSILCLPGLFRAILRPATELAAGQAAASAEARFNTIAQAMRDGIVIFGAGGTLRFVNRATEQMHGYSRGTLLGASLETLIPEEERENFRSEMDVFLRGGPTTLIGKGPVERPARRSNGQRFPVEFTWDVLPGESGRKDATFVITVREITERNRADQALRQAEEKYRGIFEEAIVGIFQTTPDGRYLSANPTLAHMFGFDSPEELMASRTDIARQDYVDPARREQFKRSIAEHGVVLDFEYEVYRKDGTKVWFLENARAIRDADGAVLYYVGAVQDVTERKCAEDVLRASEKKFRSFLESLPVAVRIIQGSHFVFANPADARLHGFESPEEEFAAGPDSQIVPEDLPQVNEYALRRAAGEEVPNRYELRRRRRDGSEFPAELREGRILYNDAPASIVAIRDLSESKRIEMYEKLLPVCCVCGKIRDDSGAGAGAGAWERLDQYLSKHTDTQFSHTFCPICFEDYKKQNLMR